MLINSYIRVDDGMGLGDFIRGSISCYQLCKNHNVDFAIDLSQHPIGKCFSYTNNFESIYPENLNSRFNFSELDSYIETFKNSVENKNLSVYCNTYPTFPIEQECKDFVKKYFILNSSVSDLKNKLFKSENYEIVHIRVGDKIAFESNGELLLDNIEIQVNNLKQHSNFPIYVFSDSYQVKNEIARRCNLFYINSKPVHTKNTNTTDQSVIDTAIDFSILCNASRIHQFTNSEHYWGSGFSHSVQWLYDINLSEYKF
jgi:hypothetical protein